MRYRLLKELPQEIALELVTASCYPFDMWSRRIGDRDIFRSMTTYSWWWNVAVWTKECGDIEYFRQSIMTSSEEWKDESIMIWNTYYKGTEYEIPTS